MRENQSPSGIYYRVNEYRSDRPTMLFVHGLSGSSSAWRDYEKRFEDMYNLISFDIRGHGKSKKWPNFDDYDIKKMAEDIDELSRLLGLPSFFIVCHSFGAPIALEFALNHLNKVAGIIFLTPIFSAKKVKYATLVLPPLSLLSTLWSRLPFHAINGSDLDYSKYEHRGYWHFARMKDDIKNTTIRVYLFCLRQIYRYEGEKNLPRLDLPALIIHGSADSIIPAENIKRASGLIRECKVRLLAGANHLLILNNSEQVSEEIDGFIKTHLVTSETNLTPIKIGT